MGGTTSDAGKSMLSAGICRWLQHRAVKVAPLKAQNMSINSVVAAGAEIGRAQAVHGVACGVEPEAAMNPVLLKPGNDRKRHVVLMGRPFGGTSVLGYRELREALREAPLAADDDLRARFDVVVCEGAGSPAEINLSDGNLVNMGLATARDMSRSSSWTSTGDHGIARGDPPPGAQPFLDGCALGTVYGTIWHGARESDGFRRAFLRDVADLAGRDFRPVPHLTFADVREARLNALGDLVADHLDTVALERLIDRGAPVGLPFVPQGAPL